MLDICNKFAAEHYLIFTNKKLPAIMYGKEVNDTEYVLPGQNAINRVDDVKDLGNSYDRIDCMVKRSTFIGSADKLMTDFFFLKDDFIRKSTKTTLLTNIYIYVHPTTSCIYKHYT